MKNNRKCVICGHEYYYCVGNCQDSVNKPSWMASFDSENCKNIYEACAGYSGNAYSAQEAKVLLDMCDLSNKKDFTVTTQRLIKEICATRHILESSRDVKEKEEYKHSEVKTPLKSQAKAKFVKKK